MSRILRTLRQKRLREVGEVGQARLFAASAQITAPGLRGEFAVRYLVGAGIHALTAPAALHAVATSIDAGVSWQDGPALDPPDAAPDFMVEPAARAAFGGALDALGIVREKLGL